jgi:hypothetical protein
MKNNVNKKNRRCIKKILSLSVAFIVGGATVVGTSFTTACATNETFDLGELSSTDLLPHFTFYAHDPDSVTRAELAAIPNDVFLLDKLSKTLSDITHKVVTVDDYYVSQMGTPGSDYSNEVPILCVIHAKPNSQSLRGQKQFTAYAMATDQPMYDLAIIQAHEGAPIHINCYDQGPDLAHLPKDHVIYDIQNSYALNNTIQQLIHD